MREDICSIPINDVFIPKDGCPFCKMRDMLEQRMAEYVTGSAMMEPDVRITTNEQGFCRRHFGMMLKTGSRLSNALILESHLKKISEELIPPKPKSTKPDKKVLAAIDKLKNDCFICNRVEMNMDNMLKSVYVMWQKDPEFKQLYSEQKFICLEHFSWLMNGAQKAMGKSIGEFYQVTSTLAGGYLEELQGDVSHFCKMFDYRNANGDWGNSRDSIERAVEYLTTRKVETNFASFNEEDEEKTE